LQEKRRLEDITESWRRQKERLEELEFFFQLALEEDDAFALKEVEQGLRGLKKEVKKLQIDALLNSPDDKCNAIVEIHAGAGGTDAQDWAEMLLRMYIKWAERRKFHTKIMDILYGDEAGIKNVTFLIEGEYSYGYLKAESGIHRLIRISPFDVSGRRHTSFAAVSVYPQVSDEIKIEIKDSDLRIETFRASGPGGQHVNKTESAVRITHLPTGISVQCQNEKSQYRNKEIALMILRSRLYDLEKRRREKKKKAIYNMQKEIAWGNQIRSYILHPYKLVRDHRTQIEVKEVEGVLDGEIDEFIEAYLLKHRD